MRTFDIVEEITRTAQYWLRCNLKCGLGWNLTNGFSQTEMEIGKG